MVLISATSTGLSCATIIDEMSLAFYPVGTVESNLPSGVHWKADLFRLFRQFAASDSNPPSLSLKPNTTYLGTGKYQQPSG